MPSCAIAIELSFLWHHWLPAHLAVGILGPSGETARQFQLASVFRRLRLCYVASVVPCVTGLCSTSVIFLHRSGPYRPYSTRLLSWTGLIPASLPFYFLRPEEVCRMFLSIFLLSFGSGLFSHAVPSDFYREGIGPSLCHRRISVGSIASKRIALENQSFGDSSRALASSYLNSGRRLSVGRLGSEPPCPGT